MADTRKPLAFLDIRAAIKRAQLPRVDLVVGIATGGTVPAALIAYELGVPMVLIHVSFRDLENRPERAEPIVLAAPTIPPEVRSVLLVDDVSVTGSTLSAAKKLLVGLSVTTLAVKGKSGAAEIVLIADRPGCVLWPWVIDRAEGEGMPVESN